MKTMVFDLNTDCPRSMEALTTGIVQEAMRQAIPCGVDASGQQQSAKVKVTLSCSFRPLHCTLTVEF